MSKSTKERIHMSTHKCVDNAKPSVAIVRLNGSVKILGSNAAARWLGMKQQEFYRIVRNILNPPPRELSYKRKVGTIMREYPELFSTQCAER